MREHSSVIRVLNPALLDDEVDDVLDVPDMPGRTIALLMCRWRQRAQQRAFDRWVVALGCSQHDHTADLVEVLQRKLPLHELRTELEIEAIYKWAARCRSNDPTGVAHIIRNCRSRAVRVRLMQDMRIESIPPGGLLLLQGEGARPGDGHVTVLEGQCELLKVSGVSRQLQALRQSLRDRDRLHYASLLRSFPCVACLRPGSGFGELVSSAGGEWPVSLSAHREEEGRTLVVFVSREPLLACLRRGTAGGWGAAVDCLRSAGLTRLWTSEEVLSTARGMRLERWPSHHLLHRHGQRGNSMLIIVSGEIIADVGENESSLDHEPFELSLPSDCYLVTRGYLLGEEAFLGERGAYHATCATVKTSAFYRLDEPGALKVAEALRISREVALVNRDRLRFSAVDISEVEANPFASIDSLRGAVALRNPFRGISGNNWSSQSTALPPKLKSMQPPRRLSKLSCSRLKSLYADLVKAKRDSLQTIAQVF